MVAEPGAPARPGKLGREVKQWFHGITPAGTTAIAAAVVVSVAAADVYTGPGVDVTLLYLGPIGFGTFFAGLGPGIGLALLAAVCGVESSRLSGENLAPPVLTWNAAQQLGVFLLLAVVLDAFKKRLLLEQQAARTDPAHLPLQPARLRRGSLAGAGARPPSRPAALAALHRLRRLQAGERPARARGRRRRAPRRWAPRCAQAVRGLDTVARLGGDEFGVLLPEVDRAGAEALAERLRLQLREALAAGETR